MDLAERNSALRAAARLCFRLGALEFTEDFAEVARALSRLTLLRHGLLDRDELQRLLNHGRSLAWVVGRPVTQPTQALHEPLPEITQADAMEWVNLFY